MDAITFTARKHPFPNEVSVDFGLQLVGSLPVHSLTTMPMLPWVVAEVRRLSGQCSKKEPGIKQVRLWVSPSGLRCEPDLKKSQQWDPLICSSIFECKPQHAHKLIHNSQDPSYFACLIKEDAAPRQSLCYVFKADDQTKVPEIISSIRQAGKIARQEELRCPSEFDDTFAKKFEVLFCGRVTVAHKKAPPALIDECIEKFNHVSCGRRADWDAPPGQPPAPGPRPMRKSFSQPGLRSLAYRKEFQDASLRSSTFSSFDSDIENHLIGGHSVVQPTDMEENRTMLFTTPQVAAENIGSELPPSATRFRLDMLKNRAKRSLTESLESILSRGNKARGLQDHSASVDLDSSTSSTLSSTSKELFMGDKEALPVSESSFKLLGSSDDLSSDSEGHSAEESALLSPQRSFRRRANTLSHFPVESQAPPEPSQSSPGVSQRKLMRYHSVSTETPHERNVDHLPGGESECCSGQPSAPPPPRLNPSASSPNFFKYLKHNSSGEPSGNAVPRSVSYRNALRKKLHSSSSVPNFLKFLAPVDENHTCDFMNTNRDFESKANHLGDTDGTPVKTRRHSWRQQIFLRVATPQKACDSPSRYEDYSELGELPPRSPLEPVCEDGPFGPVAEEKKRTSHELRELWRKAILQQILLLRMERENQKLQASENDLLNKRLKLDYEEITPCLKEVTAVWEKMLSTPGRSKIKFDMEKMHSAVGQGVPRHHRGEIWKFLAEQFLLKHPLPSKQQPKDVPYKELLKKLTSQQHAILIDLGRTFPTHPYFSAQLGAGQLSLYNILKAYSLLDQEVGYCQGLSFVAGILLLHMSEEEAFKMLKFLMFDMGLRKQYRPDMIILQIQMYQLSRLLHDYHRDLYNHLEEQEIGPSLYAAPWFLTVFASQFPLGFVARVFDMIFLQGSEVIFKVALSLLGSHKPLILQHENLETIVDFIKNTLPNLGLVQMEKTINQVFEMDIAKQLQAYEVEYHVLQEELIDSSPLSNNQRMDKLEKTNSSLRKQNLDLLEQLQVANARIQSLEATVEKLLTSESKLKQAALTLELERSALLQMVEDLRKQSAQPSTQEPDCTQPEPTGD
ncbi:TBC1 domain family member 1 isoform X5 [Onychomys torridus]|uniref:TBC1 domain family member 1 isoform X5 n=1 Tax=Onychomys torridus TaxID=38674 RepID=UPI00167F8C83|nr:TBC1 domain family member 1 isoform X5 [Onychomys torridus]